MTKKLSSDVYVCELHVLSKNSSQRCVVCAGASHPGSNKVITGFFREDNSYFPNIYKNLGDRPMSHIQILIQIIIFSIKTGKSISLEFQPFVYDIYI